MNIDETYRLLDCIEKSEGVSQRKLSGELGYSLGKINYLLKGLAEKGFVKLGNFKNSHNKSQYLYILTPDGINEKMRITRDYLKRREIEYERLRREIEELRERVGE